MREGGFQGVTDPDDVSPGKAQGRRQVEGTRTDRVAYSVARAGRGNIVDHAVLQPHGGQAERDRLVSEIRAKVAGDEATSGMFEAGLRASMLFMTARERYKTNCVKLVNEMREIGRAHV